MRINKYFSYFAFARSIESTLSIAALYKRQASLMTAAGAAVAAVDLTPGEPCMSFWACQQTHWRHIFDRNGLWISTAEMDRNRS